MKNRSFASLVLPAILLSFLGCKGDGDRRTAEPQKVSSSTKQYVVLVDLSASRDKQTRANALHFLQALGNTLNYGDQFIVVLVQQEGIRDLKNPVKVTIPVASNPEQPTPDEKDELEVGRQTVAESLPSFFRTQAGTQLLHTDLLATLAIAGDYVHERSAKSTDIIILSDMLQSTHGIEMAHNRAMPSEGWVAKQKANGQLPDFRGACVAVVGEDKTSKDDPSIKRFWTDYFRNSGTKLDPSNIWFNAPDNLDVLCR